MTTIQILGKGCPNCKKLAKHTHKAIENLDGDYAVEKVYDIVEASQMGMTTPPGLAIDGDIVLQGRIPSIDELADIIDDRGER